MLRNSRFPLVPLPTSLVFFILNILKGFSDKGHPARSTRNILRKAPRPAFHIFLWHRSCYSNRLFLCSPSQPASSGTPVSLFHQFKSLLRMPPVTPLAKVLHQKGRLAFSVDEVAAHGPPKYHVPQLTSFPASLCVVSYAAGGAICLDHITQHAWRYQDVQNKEQAFRQHVFEIHLEFGWG